MAFEHWTNEVPNWDGAGTRTLLKGRNWTEGALIEGGTAEFRKSGKGACAAAGRAPAGREWLRERALAAIEGGQDPGQVSRILARRPSRRQRNSPICNETGSWHGPCHRHPATTWR